MSSFPWGWFVLMLVVGFWLLRTFVFSDEGDGISQAGLVELRQRVDSLNRKVSEDSLASIQARKEYLALVTNQEQVRDSMQAIIDTLNTSIASLHTDFVAMLSRDEKTQFNILMAKMSSRLVAVEQQRDSWRAEAMESVRLHKADSLLIISLYGERTALQNQLALEVDIKNEAIAAYHREQRKNRVIMIGAGVIVVAKGVIEIAQWIGG